MNEEVNNLLIPGPMVSFRGAHKLSSYLVRAKLYPFHRKVGPKKCVKNPYEVWDYVTDADTFTSQENPLKLTISRTVITDVSHIS